jgi:hypothetical protein
VFIRVLCEDNASLLFIIGPYKPENPVIMADRKRKPIQNLMVNHLPVQPWITASVDLTVTYEQIPSQNPATILN